jgi:hypothetical protein
VAALLLLCKQVEQERLDKEVVADRLLILVEVLEPVEAGEPVQLAEMEILLV